MNSHIAGMQMWQEVEKFKSFITFIPTVEMMFRPFDIGNPAVGVAVEVRAHVSKDKVWHLWLGICPSGFDFSPNSFAFIALNTTDLKIRLFIMMYLYA